MATPVSLAISNFVGPAVDIMQCLVSGVDPACLVRNYMTEFGKV